MKLFQNLSRTQKKIIILINLLIFGGIIGVTYHYFYNTQEITTTTTTTMILIVTQPTIKTVSTLPTVATQPTTTSPVLATSNRAKLSLNFPPGAYSKLMVVGGRNQTTNFNFVEVFDLSLPENECTDVPNLKTPNEGLIMGLSLESMPLVCGGSDDFAPVKECYALSNGTWTEYGNLNRTRLYSASGYASINGTQRLIVVGGENASDAIILTENGWQHYTYLPVPMDTICIAILDDLMVIPGGWQSYEVSDITRIYNFTSEEWSLGPKLASKFMYTPCGTVKKGPGSNDSVFVFISPQYSYFYEFGDSKWTRGPILNVANICVWMYSSGFFRWYNNDWGLVHECSSSEHNILSGKCSSQMGVNVPTDAISALSFCSFPYTRWLCKLH